ncbi:MAG: hypothetical protein ABWZ83_00070 [Mesorhizobium sp.]
MSIKSSVIGGRFPAAVRVVGFSTGGFDPDKKPDAKKQRNSVVWRSGGAKKKRPEAASCVPPASIDPGGRDVTPGSNPVANALSTVAFFDVGMDFNVRRLNASRRRGSFSVHLDNACRAKVRSGFAVTTCANKMQRAVGGSH